MARLGRGVAIGANYLASYLEVGSAVFSGKGTSTGITTLAAAATVNVPSVRFGSGTSTGTTTGAALDVAVVQRGSGTSRGVTTTGAAIAVKVQARGTSTGTTGVSVSPTGIIGGNSGLDFAALDIIAPRRLLPHRRRRRR